ncbi:MAG: hypothetical protein OEW68_01320 [Gammaproteobacteria bacterium]|nr:hypothetical protein [Gammaproteobacteria bacterium]
MKSVPGSGAQAIPGVTDELTEAVEITGQRLRELDRAAERLSPANRPATGASTVPAPDQPGDSQSDRFCDAEMTRTPAAWWACIEKLNRSGNLQSAQSELERLEAEFPDYRPSR